MSCTSLPDLIVGAIATSVVWATHPGDAEVRVAGRILEDGRVEVGLQQRLAEDADWGEVERPDIAIPRTGALSAIGGSSAARSRSRPKSMPRMSPSLMSPMTRPRSRRSPD